MLAYTPSTLKKRVQVLAARPQDRFLELAAALGALHAVASAAQFREATKSAGLGSRKAYYLVNIAERFRPHMRYRSRLQRLGWTKCQIIAAQLPQGDLLGLLRWAEAHSAKELDTRVRRNLAGRGTRCVLLYFSSGEYRRYEEALLQFGATKRGRGLRGKEKATMKMGDKVIGR
jgi:hypothetical protein